MAKKLFVSFSTVDGKDFAAFVYDVYKKKGFDVFYSEEEIPVGSEWERVIREHLEPCDTFLLIATSETLESEKVAREVREARQHNRKIIPCKYIEVDWSDSKNWNYIHCSTSNLKINMT